VYRSKDFKRKVKEKKLFQQNNKPEISIRKQSGIFDIDFGNNRKLIEGILKIRHNQQIYSNHQSLSKNFKRLLLKSDNESKGNDDLGGFKKKSFTFQLEGLDIEIIASIKEYPNHNFIIFELKFPNGLSDVATGKYKLLTTMFPSFLNESPNQKVFNYRHAIFCPPDRKLTATSSPVVFYDDELNCFIVSPLDGFLNTAIAKSEDGRINCGFQGEIKDIPENSSQKFVILFGKGINKPLEELGDLLRKYHKVKRKDPYCSIAVSHLSYWTDNGAYYYYRKEKGMSYEDTMVAVKDYFETHNIPIQSYNFDSWWYLKYLSTTKKFLSSTFKPLYRLLGGGLFGNTIRWETDPTHFSTDLATYHRERFKYPIIAHARRWDARSPYIEKYEFEVFKNHAVPLKKEFWDWCMKYAKESGIDVYEQDWMKNQTKSIPILREKFTAKEEWLNSMATAARENEVDVFYCMMTPGMLLYSMKHPNIVMARCSGDYNHRWPLTFRFIFGTQTCILFNAVGINPHQDVFSSSYERMGEHYPELKCLLEILTAGVVAPGDKKEKVNWPLLRKTCRDDGLLLKPDKPLTANDLMFKKHKKYYICDTYTKRDDLIWRYILVVNIWPKRARETYFTLEELGFEEEKYIYYNYNSKNMYKTGNKDKITVGMLNKYEHSYCILSPITKNGMALIGCPDKFVTCSRKQFPMIKSTEELFIFSIEDIAGAIVNIIVYSNKKPSSINFEDGTALKENNTTNSWKYISDTNIVQINLKFEKSEIKTIVIQK